MNGIPSVFVVDPLTYDSTPVDHITIDGGRTPLYPHVNLPKIMLSFVSGKFGNAFTDEKHFVALLNTVMIVGNRIVTDEFSLYSHKFKIGEGKLLDVILRISATSFTMRRLSMHVGDFGITMVCELRKSYDGTTNLCLTTYESLTATEAQIAMFGGDVQECESHAEE